VVRTRGDDEDEQRLIDDVERVGWHLVGVEEDSEGPGFVYSVGMYHTWSQPEIIVFGLSSVAKMIEMINALGDEMRQGAGFDDWHENDHILEGSRCMFRKVERDIYAEYLGHAVWFYAGRDFPALQCVWPDQGGHYPWEPEFAEELTRRQPMLTQKVGWPFHAGKNRAVFTTRPVLEGRQPVVWVTHDQQGDWQFLCGTTNRTEDSRLASLSTVVANNPTLLELVDLPVGWQAIRESPDRPWQRMRL
jgi:hypothetical protein